MVRKLIYLVRHGDIGLEKEKRFIGQSDLPLSTLGREQAILLKKIFSRVPIDNIYCSDLLRAQQTAEIIASAHPIIPTTCAELRELHMGVWEGKSFAEIKAKYPEEFKERGKDIVNYRPPKGESFSDCYGRVKPVFEYLSESVETTILIVGHAGVNRVILCHVLGIPLENVFRLEQNYGCVNLITKEGLKNRLKYCNYIINRDLYRMD
ncbi:alpha-ribazole phosphatase [Desulfosporosinus nitroreducens]|uniref:Alpha-ribazole phosphatase n=1 Tax=Desulfosporosinus nitroreducens TaxID=2018668 RepID=A0ABT8QQ30_9FIRM|nr:alpha-ribazole phosphatase [Desulfosporosinus nitroreducens]MDO0823400.1 alpha-ribazole phosphatase [Desulfosporosinus nitroreducens]